MIHDITLISHFALDDKIFFKKNETVEEKNQIGGPPAYGMLITPFVKQKIRLITSHGKDFPLSKISLKTEDLIVELAEKTTRFRHEIFQNHRILYLLETASSLDNLAEKTETGTACICSPIFKEINTHTLEVLSQRYEILAADIQGFLRYREKNNQISFKFSKEEVKKVLTNTNFVKMSQEEALFVTGEKSIPKIFSKLKTQFPLLTLGKEGVAYKKGNKIYQIKAPSVIEIDPTGAGDVFLTAFISKLIETDEIDFSIAFGIALASHSVTTKGNNPLPRVNYKKIAEDLLNSKSEITA